jgi:hypothetical protein
MSDQPEQDPWDLLASELGTPPPPPKKTPQQGGKSGEGPETTQPEKKDPAAGIPPKGPAKRRDTSAPAPARTAADWGQLASELGIAVPAVSERPLPPPPEPVRRPVAPAAFGPAETTLRLPREPESFASIPADTSPDLGEAPVEPRRWSRAPSQESEAGESTEKRPGRRRRKRRRRTRVDEHPETPRPEPLGEFDAESDDVVAEHYLETPPADAATEEAPAEGEAAPRTERETSGRPRRRRRRRPGRKPGEAERSPGSQSPARSDAAADSAGAAPLDDHDESDEEDDAFAGEEDEESAEGSDLDSRRLKLIHRGVPTWKEAVDMLISANMESRAKRPDKGPSSRPRGGRDRGGRNHPRGHR